MAIVASNRVGTEHHLLRRSVPRRTASSPVRSALIAVAALLAVLLGASLVGGAPAGAQSEAESLRPGEIVVTQAVQGTVVALDENGSSRELISGLETPRGVAVLSDQTVLVAENGADRIVAFGPVYGPNKIKVADVVQPESLAVAPDGKTIYVTSFAEGTLARFDLESTDRTPTVVADGFQQLTGVFVRGADVYVAEVTTSSIYKVDPETGESAVFATGVGGPFGITGTADGPLYVSDYQNDRVLAIAEDGTVSEFASVPKPVGIAVDPVDPKPNEPYLLSVATNEAVLFLDQEAGEALPSVPFPPQSAVGVSVVPGGSLPIAGQTPSTVAGSSTTSTERATGTTLAGAGGAGEDGTSVLGPLLVAVLFLIVVGVGIVVAVQVGRRNRSTAEAGFADLTSDYTMTEAVGPCAAMEVEQAGAEQALIQVREQIAGARRRQEEASRRVERSKVTVTAAERAVERGESKPAVPTAPTGQFTLEQLNLQSEEGRTALRAFGRKEITAAELRMRWEALGEEDAVRAVLGEAAAAAQAASDDPAAGVDRARAELAEAEAEKLQATTDLGRFAERERQLEQRLEAARKALDDCLAEQRRTEDDAAAEAAAAFAAAQLSEDDKWAEFVLEGDRLPPEGSSPAAGTKPGEAKKPEDAKKPGEAKKPGDVKKPEDPKKPGEAKKPGDVKKPEDAKKPGEAKKLEDPKEPGGTDSDVPKIFDDPVPNALRPADPEPPGGPSDGADPTGPSKR